MKRAVAVLLLLLANAVFASGKTMPDTAAGKLFQKWLTAYNAANSSLAKMTELITSAKGDLSGAGLSMPYGYGFGEKRRAIHRRSAAMNFQDCAAITLPGSARDLRAGEGDPPSRTFLLPQAAGEKACFGESPKPARGSRALPRTLSV